MPEAFVFWGGYGGRNLGDEAILWSLSRLIRKLRPTAKLYVLVRGEISAQTSAAYAEWKLEVIGVGLLPCLKILRNARLIVGGGQLVDDKGLVWPVGWTSLFLVVNRVLGHRPLILFVGAEPVARRLTRYLVRFAYSLAQVCVCRDADSAGVLQAIGLPAAKLWCGKDVVFSINPEVIPTRGFSESASPKVAVLVAKDVNQLSENMTARLRLLVTTLIQSGINVTLVAHDLRRAYDLGALLSLETKYKDEPRVSSCGAKTVQSVLQLYSQCDAVISARMHPLILASLVGALPIAIVNTRKVRSLVQLLGVPTLDLSDGPERQLACVSEILAKRERYTQDIRKRCRVFGLAVEEMAAKALSE
jgi:polysaccharide pyruvyl transferase WcaK-like protein